MIHRVEAGYLRTQDSLSKREKQARRRRRVPSAPESEAEPTDETTASPERDQQNATLDLVA